jgi:hypothetical protein
MKHNNDRELSVFERIVGIVWRSIIVGTAYTLTTFCLGALLAKQGIPFPDMDKLGMSKMWFLGSSVLMGFVIGAISQIVHTSKLNHIMTWTILLFLNPFSVTLESAFLAPELLTVATIPALMIVQFVAALVASLLITFLFSSNSKQSFGSYFHRPGAVWTMRFSICLGITLLIYSLLSATNYHLISKLYHDNYQISLAMPTAEVIFAIEFMRALLVILSLIPMVITIGATKRFIAVICGITLVVLGILSPFLQVSNLSMFLLLASSGKIFLQNFLIGLLVGFVLGHPSRLEEDGISVTDYLRPVFREALENNVNFFQEKFSRFKKSPADTVKLVEEEPETSEQIYFKGPLK